MPDALVEAEVTSHLENESRLEDDEHRAEVDESTRKALRAQFLLDAIAEKEEVNVGQQELIEYLVMTASQYGMEPNDFAKAVDEGGQIPAMVAEVARRKALAAVLEKAKVVDADGNEVDLNALNPARTRVDDHEGHDHEGHDHEGHDHEGHDHEGHDHEGHDRRLSTPADGSTRGPRGRVPLRVTGARASSYRSAGPRGSCVAMRRAGPRGLRGGGVQDHQVCEWRRAGPPGLRGAGGCALTANRAVSRDFPRRPGR